MFCLGDATIARARALARRQRDSGGEGGGELAGSGALGGIGGELGGGGALGRIGGEAAGEQGLEGGRAVIGAAMAAEDWDAVALAHQPLGLLQGWMARGA